VYDKCRCDLRGNDSFSLIYTNRGHDTLCAVARCVILRSYGETQLRITIPKRVRSRAEKPVDLGDTSGLTAIG